MLNVYISTDLEGVNGVVYPFQTDIIGGESYKYAIKQQHNELNSIIEALIECGVNRITINDAHNSMENLKLTELIPKIELITGKPKPISMMAGLTNEYTYAFFIGYHAKAGSVKGVIPHTISQIFKTVKLNGNLVGEIKLNAIFAGMMNVPVSLLTGDDVACEEAINELNGIKTVCTKKCISSTSAKCKSNEKLHQELKATVKEIIQSPNKATVIKTDALFELEVDFSCRNNADIAEFLPGIQRISATEVKFISDNYLEIYKLLQFFAMTLK